MLKPTRRSAKSLKNKAWFTTKICALCTRRRAAGVTFPIPVDEVIDTMGKIGREMDVRYRETAGGGLAATPTGRRLAKERLVQLKPRG